MIPPHIFAVRPRSDPSLAAVVGRWFFAPARTAVCLLTASAATLGFYLVQPPRFEARTDVVVVAIPSFSIQDTLNDISIDSAVQLLTSDQVLGATAAELNYPGSADGLEGDLIISPVVNSRILRLYVRNEDADLALQAVESLTHGLLATRSGRLERASENRLEEIRVRLTAINAELDNLASVTEPSDRDQDAIDRLVEERVALDGELAGIEALPTEAGFISRAPAVTEDPQRPYAPVFIGTGLAVGLCVAWVVAPAERRRTGTANYGGTE